MYNKILAIIFIFVFSVSSAFAQVDAGGRRQQPRGGRVTVLQQEANETPVEQTAYSELIKSMSWEQLSATAFVASIVAALFHQRHKLAQGYHRAVRSTFAATAGAARQYAEILLKFADRLAPR